MAGVGVAEGECTTWTGEHFAAPVFEAAWWTPEDSELVTSARLRGAGRATGLKGLTSFQISGKA